MNALNGSGGSGSSCSRPAATANAPQRAVDRSGVATIAGCSNCRHAQHDRLVRWNRKQRQAPTWGSAGSAFLRMAEAAYADGISAPSGADRPNPRDISNALMSQLEATESASGMSNFVYAWGQFIDHDIDLTDTATPAESFNISVPTGDDYFDPAGTGTKTISLSRSNWDPTTGTGTTNPRQQSTASPPTSMDRWSTAPARRPQTRCEPSWAAS